MRFRVSLLTTISRQFHLSSRRLEWRYRDARPSRSAGQRSARASEEVSCATCCNLVFGDVLTLLGLGRLEGGRRVLVGISGIPGSGKSLLAVNLVRALNSAWQSRLEVASGEDVAICVGMDGWHYPRSVLSTFPNAQEAFDRRGAEWTFDAKRFADFVVTVKSTTSIPLYAPSFDHAKKDPLEDDVAVLPSHRVVVFEGLYCNCDVGEWKRAAEQFDVRLVFEISKQDAKTRLITRHVATGVAKDTEEAIWRGKRARCRRSRLYAADYRFTHICSGQQRSAQRRLAHVAFAGAIHGGDEHR